MEGEILLHKAVRGDVYGWGGAGVGGVGGVGGLRQEKPEIWLR